MDETRKTPADQAAQKAINKGERVVVATGGTGRKTQTSYPLTGSDTPPTPKPEEK